MASSKKRKPQRRRAERRKEDLASPRQTAFQAYRDDLGDASPATADGGLLAVAVLLQQAAQATSKTARERLRRSAVDSARSILGPEWLELGCVMDEHPARKWFDVVRALAEF